MSEENKNSQPDDELELDLTEEVAPTAPVEEVKKKLSEVRKQVMVPTEGLDFDETVAIPSYRQEDAKQHFSRLPNLEGSLADADWAQAIQEGLQLSVHDDGFTASLDKGDFTNAPIYNERILKPGAIVPRVKAGIQELSGDAATIAALSHFGQGDLRQIPMWHSGFWVMFRPPTNTEVINLHHQIVSDKITMGRYTYGSAFASTTIMTVRRLLDFARAHIFSTTVKGEELHPDNILQYLDERDVHAFIYGMACSMYPKGFAYSRSCFADIEKCKHIEKGMLDMGELLEVDFDVLSPDQKQFMSQRKPREQSLESVLAYQKALSKTFERSFKVYEGQASETEFVLKSITAATHIQIGMSWINDIAQTVDDVLASDAMLGERNEMYMKHMLASHLRQYGHFVKSIRIGNHVITDIGSIQKTLGALGGDAVMKDRFTKEVKRFLDDSIFAIIGIETYECPNCGGSAQKIQYTAGETIEEYQVPTYPRMAEIIPLDPVQLFFDLLKRRVSLLIG